VGGTEVLGLSNDRMRRIRGREVAMIFQDPLTALHPFYKVGAQISEAYRAHHDVSKAKARAKAIEMLDRVGIPQARTRVDDYPHQFSGGMLLPWVMIGISYSTQYARFSRGAMVDALNEDYVRTARAKGLAERIIVRRHALRAAIVPVVTIFGLDFAYLLAGTIFTEKIFGIQGLGLAGLDAVTRTDLPIISATVMMGAAAIVLANIVVDILYSVIDPRVRLT
jgi:ABC-type dipeptide/oligopeptide/nickel transport system permease component